MTIESPRPRHGQLIPLKTKAELSVTEDTIEVFVAEVPSRSINGLITYVYHILIWLRVGPRE